MNTILSDNNPILFDIKTVMAVAVEQLERESPSAKLDVVTLLCSVLDKPSSYLFTWPEKQLTIEQYQHFNKLLTKRKQGIPIAYIVGKREFWSLSLKVSTASLIPRPETEKLVELALELANDQVFGNILDLGTGTGAIALALGSRLSNWHIIGVDKSDAAVTLAQDNANNLQIKNTKFLCGSWFEPLASADKFHIITSNPPYIDENDPHLSQGDVRFEPRSALVAKDHGLADINHIISNAKRYLSANGNLLIEHGYDQGIQVRQLFHHFGYIDIFTAQDYAGCDRVTIGKFVQNN